MPPRKAAMLAAKQLQNALQTIPIQTDGEAEMLARVTRFIRGVTRQNPSETKSLSDLQKFYITGEPRK